MYVHCRSYSFTRCLYRSVPISCRLSGHRVDRAGRNELCSAGRVAAAAGDDKCVVIDVRTQSVLHHYYRLTPRLRHKSRGCRKETARCSVFLPAYAQ